MQPEPSRHDLHSVLSWFGDPVALLAVPAFRSRYPQYESETEHTPPDIALEDRPPRPVSVTFEHLLAGGRVIQVATRRKRHRAQALAEHVWGTLRNLVASELTRHGWQPMELAVVLATSGAHPPDGPDMRTLQIDGIAMACPFMVFDDYGAAGLELERIVVAVAAPVDCFDPPGIALEIVGRDYR